MNLRKQNQFNLLIVFALLIFVVACSCPSFRDGKKDIDNNQNSNSVGDVKNIDSGSEKPDNGDFVVQYSKVQNPRFVEIDSQIKRAKVLEKAADKLNRQLSLPNDIPLRTKDCGNVNAFYNPKDRSITFCYELMEHFFKLFKGAGDSTDVANKRMNQAINFVFLHELGHALIHNYDVQITANEEDAADRCSSYICIEELGKEGVDSILAAADAFILESKMNKKPDSRQLADEHLLQEQRFFNSLCMVYGSDPNKYQNFVKNGYLPQARARRCPTEYNRIARSWGQILKPWRKE